MYRDANGKFCSKENAVSIVEAFEKKKAERKIITKKMGEAMGEAAKEWRENEYGKPEKKEAPIEKPSLFKRVVNFLIGKR